MRSFLGWRFLLVIALPLLLASLGVLALTFDLLERISDNANDAEFRRNRGLVTQAFKNAENELARLAQDNAHWDEAYKNLHPEINATWFKSNIGHFTNTGTSYDLVAVISADSPVALIARSPEGDLQNFDAASVIGAPFHALQSQMPADSVTPKTASTVAMTKDGPAIVALSNISSANADPAARPKQLLLIRKLSTQTLEFISTNYLVRDLTVVPVHQATTQNLKLHDASGNVAFALTWKDRELGFATTGFAKQKASAALGFLLLVMTMIGYVCWRLVGNVADNEAQALHASLHDALTGLPNRNALLQHMKSLTGENFKPHTIAFADLDGFKEVNDSFGHEIGDRLICAVASGLLMLADKASLCCRLGGDEFVVLFEGEDSEKNAKAFADNLIHLLVKPFEMEGRIMIVGASIGIATSFRGDIDETEVLRRADISMYKAKADGKNRARIYNETFDSERNENLAIARELRGLIQSRALDINFQPVIDARTGRISGVEALARWPQSSSNKITADRFIAVAESSGLVDDLGELILERACLAARNWPELRLAVNVSAVQLNNPRFVERSLAVLKRFNVNPHNTEFEITETSLIRDADRAKSVFKQLQLAGIKVALDDFGTGFSSIGYLRTFKFDRIKIDKSIVSKVLTNPAELAIVQGTLLVARGLSAQVTAEGVEHEEEVAILRLAGCTELQGYYFHKPMPSSEINVLVENLRRLPPAGAAA